MEFGETTLSGRGRIITPSHEGTNAQWDDGSIANATKLQSLLPSSAMIGANGAGMSCAFGNTYQGTVAGADCSNVGDTTLWEGYGGYVNIHDPSVSMPKSLSSDAG